MTAADVIEIEKRAQEVLARYREEVASFTLPVPVDLIGECLLGLIWDWELLEEAPGVHIWAGLYTREGRVVLNEAHKDMFEANEGIERFTKAHEIGHWVLHVGRDAASGLTEPEHMNRDLILTRNGDESEIELQANAFAAALVLPRDLLVEEVRVRDLSTWPSIYELRELFGVSISAMTMRLAKLDLAFFDAKSNIYRNYADYESQNGINGSV